MKPITRLLLKCQRVADSCTNVDQAMIANRFIERVRKSDELKGDREARLALVYLIQPLISETFGRVR